MKFFVNTHNPKVHPLSKKIVDETMRVLEEHGMVSLTARAKCSLALFQATIRHCKKIQSVTAKLQNSDELLAKQSEELKAILKKHGVEDEAQQEEIVLAYLEVCGNL